jgi:hypothetical protein
VNIVTHNRFGPFPRGTPTIGRLGAPLLSDEGFHTYYGMPPIAKGTVQGVLDIFHRAPLIASPAWRDLLETRGSQAVGV